MKVAVAATGPTINAEVASHCRRCNYFLIVDADNMEVESIKNTSAMTKDPQEMSVGGIVARKGAEAVLTGNCDPNAFRPFTSHGLHVVEGMTGKVKEAVETYKRWHIPPIM